MLLRVLRLYYLFTYVLGHALWFLWNTPLLRNYSSVLRVSYVIPGNMDWIHERQAPFSLYYHSSYLLFSRDFKLTDENRHREATEIGTMVTIRQAEFDYNRL